MSQNESEPPETTGQGAPLKRKRDLASLIDELVPTSTAALTPMAALEASRTEGRVKTAQYIQASLLLNRQSISAEALAPDTMLTPTELTELDFALAEGRIVPADFVRIYNGGVSRQPATPEKTMSLETIDSELGRLYGQVRLPRILEVWCSTFLFMLPIAVPIGISAERSGWWLFLWLGSCLGCVSFRNAQETQISNLEWLRHRESKSKSAGPIGYRSLWRMYGSICVINVPWAAYLIAID